MGVQSLREFVMNEFKSPRFLLGKKRHENVVSKERESSQAQTSHPVKNGRSQSEIRIRKSWSPRFLRKKKSDDNPKLKESEASTLAVEWSVRFRSYVKLNA